MGREIRKVPADWEHPRYTADTAPRPNLIGKHVALFDQDYESACIEWYDGLKDFTPSDDFKFYHERAGDPPTSPEYGGCYRERKWTEEEATHYQLYQTVSEGSPISPVFPSLKELGEYLQNHGDDWGKFWTAEGVRQLVELGWTPSMTIVNGEVRTPEQGCFNEKA